METIIKTKTLTIDPSADGTTAYCLINEQNQIEFKQFKSIILDEHYKELNKLVKKYQPTRIIYEDIQHINAIGKNTGSLFKLFGVIESLKFTFTFIKRIDSIYSSQIKALRKRILHNKKRIEGINYKIGFGWFYQEQKISVHQLDAFLVYYIWKNKNYE